MTPNVQQQAAIDSEHERILCIAGPGSGKTGTAAKRVLRLIEQGCDPQDIAIIAYTNSAAKEFESRLMFGPLKGDEVNTGFLGTLHAFCLKHINEFGGYDRAVTVLDDEEADEELWRAAVESGVVGCNPKAIRKDLEWTRKNWMEERHLSTTPARIAVGKYYRTMMQTASLDYNSILMVAADLLTDREKGRRHWKHLLVDEYQDAARIDAHIYHHASADNRFFVGDPDQNCFSFRGSDITEILHLARSEQWEKHYLETNFRCTPVICEAAQRLIEHSTRRIPKRTIAQETANKSAHKPISDLTDSEGSVHVYLMDDSDREVLGITDFLAARMVNDEDMNDYAVLARTNRITDDIREALLARGVDTKAPNKLVPPADWRLARAALNLLCHLNSEEAMKRWIRIIEPTADVIIREREQKQEKIIWTVITEKRLTGDADKLLPELNSLGVSYESRIRIKAKFDELPETSDLNDLLVALTIEPFDEKQIGEGVSVLTVHGAKGMEWGTVIFAGFEDGVIPGNRKHPDIEEERRIAFIGFTRAKKELIITHARARRENWGLHRMVQAKPSRFLAEAGL